MNTDFHHLMHPVLQHINSTSIKFSTIYLREVLKELSAVEVREMLEAIAWRKVREEWGQEMETKPTSWRC